MTLFKGTPSKSNKTKTNKLLSSRILQTNVQFPPIQAGADFSRHPSQSSKSCSPGPLDFGTFRQSVTARTSEPKQNTTVINTKLISIHVRMTADDIQQTIGKHTRVDSGAKEISQPSANCLLSIPSAHKQNNNNQDGVGFHLTVAPERGNSV